MNTLEVANSTFTSTVILTDDLLHCPNCNKELFRPKLLECLHSFCQECLEICLRSNNIQAGHSFLCPLCRTKCKVPKGGVKDIKDNILIQSMHNFLNFRNEMLQDVPIICSGCGRIGIKKSKAKKCMECNDWLCRNCCDVHTQVKASKTHRLFTSEELLSGDMDGIIKEHIAHSSCSKHEENFTSYCSNCRCLLCLMCETTSHAGHETLSVKERSDLESESIQSFLPQVGRTIESLSTKISNLSKQQKSIHNFRKNFHKTYTERIIEVINAMTKRLNDYSDFLHKTVDGLISDRLEKISKLKLDDLKDEVEAARVSVEISEELILFDYPQCTMSLKDAICHQLLKFQKIPKLSLVRWTEYSLGRNEELLDETVEELIGSLTYNAKPKHDTSLYSFITRLETDFRPCVISDMALDAIRSEIVIVDEANKNMKAFDFEGSLRVSSKEGFLKAPIRAVVLRGDEFYLVNDENSLKLAEKDLNKNRIFCSFKFRQPVAITQSTNGEILVAEWMSGEIIGFDESGVLVRKFPCYSASPAYLSCCHDTDHVVLSDWGSHSIKIFHWNGNFISSYGQRGDDTGDLDHPHGVGSDSESRIVVCDSWNNRIEVLDWKGRHLLTFLDRKNGLLWPQSISILRQHCFVAERHGIVKVFEYKLSTS